MMRYIFLIICVVIGGIVWLSLHALVFAVVCILLEEDDEGGKKENEL